LGNKRKELFIALGEFLTDLMILLMADEPI
jgi:hypothetical protein